MSRRSASPPPASSRTASSCHRPPSRTSSPPWRSTSPSAEPAPRHGQPYSVVALDVDGLKSLNDSFGHEMGDLALRAFANTVKKSVRASDVGVRTGGDEFLVLMPQTGLDEAKVVAERLRATVEAHGRAEPRSAITVSAGAATWRPGRRPHPVLQAPDSTPHPAPRPAH